MARRTTLLLGIGATALTLAFASAAQAATFAVNSTVEPGNGVCNATECTLREALDAANANGSSEVDQIPINANGTIEVASALAVQTPTNIVGPGPGLLTVRRDSSAAGTFRMLQLGTPGGTAISISGLAVTGANAGAIDSKYDDAVVTLANVSVFGNATTANGAGIKNDGTMTITRSAIGTSANGNAAIGAGGAGGGIYNTGTLAISASTIGRNSAPGGGGITNTGTLTMVNSTVSSNYAYDFGGGIENAGNTTLSSVTIAGNVANDDGGPWGDGGGTWNGAGSTTVGNTVYYGNVVMSGAGTSGHQCAGVPPHVSQGYNLRESSDSACVGFNAAGDIVNNGFTLGPLADNGGATATQALPAGAAAIDAGNPATPGSGGGACPPTDQRDLYRGGGAGRCDIGAFELGATVSPPVTSPGKAVRKKCKKRKKRAKKRAEVAKKKKCKRKRGRR